MIYWRFKNHDATSAFQRFTIRLTSIFICFTKTRKTWKLIFVSTLDCTSIINRWITFSTMYARFVSKWRIINESMCTMFIMFHSASTRLVTTSRNDSIRFEFDSDFAESNSCRVEVDTVSIWFDSISNFFDFDSKSKWTSTLLCNDHVLFINFEFCDY
jgi:hypothetical protein